MHIEERSARAPPEARLLAATSWARGRTWQTFAHSVLGERTTLAESKVVDILHFDCNTRYEMLIGYEMEIGYYMSNSLTPSARHRNAQNYKWKKSQVYCMRKALNKVQEYTDNIKSSQRLLFGQRVHRIHRDQMPSDPKVFNRLLDYQKHTTSIWRRQRVQYSRSPRSRAIRDRQLMRMRVVFPATRALQSSRSG